MSQVRVRFAPSPTGFFHIGGARTALFNWLYARHTGGTFILRIEDTDRARNTSEALRRLLDGLRWLGLDWDEGPDAGGDFGPYFQSQRGPVYHKYLEKLRASDRAYDKDGAVWFKISGEPQVIEDAVRGRTERTEEKDFVIVRTDGQPVFHFVNVVDDLAMRVTYVIRGEDHLSNTSKHTELFRAFEAPPPVYAHIPLILKPQGQGKMSKRDEGSLIEEYRRRRFLPEALRNYLCLLGWNPKDGREIMPLTDIIRLFDFDGIHKGNARFDEKKLAAFNAGYLRRLPFEEFMRLAKPALLESGVIRSETDGKYLREVLALCQEKAASVDGLPEYVRYFFTEDYPTDQRAKEKLFRKNDPRRRITELLPAFGALTDFSDAELEKTVVKLAEKNNVKTGGYIHAARLALTGMPAGPSFYGLVRVLGKERTLRRFRRFLSGV